ncbi:pentatricopeptide repeat-containing protein At5g14080 isoform X1 [Macadamia integrifolia]|uniref:pentatricopeptide repeat-containing protein At5g14080 isoform X1 n=1 Tax=Macadamia integrifolia TaxID=60698 RepID=UPI001C4E8261|nr:pentatricopeptide repeat-containing protein At5g14080 isoform X1 [Macadamia integrifolia]
MKRAPIEAAKIISNALISASIRSRPTRSWSPLLEQTLHQLGCRDSLTPSLVARVIDPFLLDHHSLAIGFFNWVSQRPGFSHTAVTYQSLLKSLSISRQFNSVDKLLKQIKTQKIIVDPSVYRSVIASQIIGKKAQSAFLVFNEVKELVHKIGSDTCNSLLAALASDGCIDSAKEVFDEMGSRSIPLSTLGFGVFIGRFCRTAELDETLGLLDGIKHGIWEMNGSIVALLIVDGLCRVSRISEAFKVLEELRSRACKPDFMAYRIVAEAFRSVGELEKTEVVLKKKRKLGVAPREKDYREFIFALISERRVQEVKELGEVIVSGNFPIEEDVLNALIGSVSSIDPECAIMFFKSMLGQGRLPTLLTLSNLSRNLSKRGMIDEMLQVFQVLSSKDYFSDLESYNLMVSFLCKAGRVKEAYAVLGEMRRRGFGPDVSVFNSLMEACCREDLLRPAKRLWDEMFASGCPGNLRTYNILIQKFSETGEVEEAQHLFHHMLGKGVSPDATTYTSVLEGLCREAKAEAACETFNKCVDQDALLARTILSRLVLSLCKGGHFVAASRVVRRIGPHPEISNSHVILLRCLVDAGEFKIAIEHVKWVRDTSPSILRAVFSELQASLTSSLNPEPILQLLSKIKEPLVSNNDTWVDVMQGRI